MVAHFSPEILEKDKTGEISVTAQLCHQSGDYIKASGQALMALSLVLAGLRAAPPTPPCAHIPPFPHHSRQASLSNLSYVQWHLCPPSGNFQNLHKSSKDGAKTHGLEILRN